MSSKVKSYESGALENQFILRLPKKQASVVKNALTAGTLKDKLSIEFQADNRHATVRVSGVALSSKLVDLPCLLESQKTLDSKSFYKTADVCQMLVCLPDSDPGSDGESDSKHSHKKESKKFIWNHGITPPLKNGRKRRFRKMAKKKVSESPEIEKEVKRLLRTDLSAATVTFEVLNDEEKPEESQNISLPSDADLSGNTLQNELSQMTTTSDDEERNELLKLLQEASSDEEEEDEQDQSQENYDDVDVEGDDNDESDQGLKSQLEDAREKLEEIRSSKAQQIARVNGAANPFLKERFQKILEGILQQEKEQQQELEKLENELAETS